MLVIPLLFSALVVGVAEMGDLKSLGRAGIKTLLLTIVVSGIAVRHRPGHGQPLPSRRRRRSGPGAAAAGPGRAKARRPSSRRRPRASSSGQFFLDLIPSNVFTAASENQILPVMIFALLFGIGLVMAKSPNTDRLQNVIEGILEVTMKLINLVIKLAPIAIACLMFNLAALFGWDLLVRLAAYVGVAVGRHGDPHVRRLSAGRLDRRRHEPADLLQGRARADGRGLLHRLVQRRPAGVAEGRGRAS